MVQTLQFIAHLGLMHNQGTGDVDRTVLAELPENYVLYVHKSQKAYDPRTDAYLVGMSFIQESFGEATLLTAVQARDT